MFVCTLWSISGCGANDVVTTTATGASATINAGQTIQIPVAAPSNANWTLTGTGCSDKTCGTVAPAADAVLYIAPPAVGSQIRVTAIAGDASATAGTKFDVTVNPALTLDVTLSDGSVDTPYTATVSATGGSNPRQLSLADGALPDGLQFNASSGLISGTPKADGDYPVTFKATDASNAPTATQLHRTLHVWRHGSGSSTALHVTTSSLASGIVGSAYQAQLAATGGAAPYTWSVASGALPTGIALTSSGAIQGTPTTAGLASFTIQAVDSNGTSDTASLKLNINSAQTSLIIGNTTLSPAQINTAYSAQFNISGGTAPYTCAIAGGSMPRGLQLNGCGIAGTPTVAGNTTFELAVTDAAGSSTSARIALTVNPSVLTVMTSSLPSTVVGSAYATNISVAGGVAPYNCTVKSGSLPAGIALSGCQIVGTATTAGTSTLVVGATDAAGASASSNNLSLTVAARQSTLTISSPSAATVGMAYAGAIGVAGGTAPYTCTITSGSVPVGLTLSGCSLTGTPTTAGTTSLGIKATDASSPANSTASTITVTVNPAAQKTLTIVAPSAGTVGTAYNNTIAVTGGTAPYTCSLVSGTLPSGLTMSNCQISGTPKTAGNTNLTVKANDSSTPSASVTSTVPLVVNAAASSLLITSPPAATVGKAYTGTIGITGGIAPFTCSLASGTVPPGLTLSGCSLTGTPTTAGNYTLGIKALDSSVTAISATGNITVTINAAQVALTLTSPSAATVGSAYNGTIGVSGGTGPYTCKLASGTVPAGLTLNGCALTGTPTTAGTSQLSIQATDSNSPANVTTAAVNVVVNAAAPPVTASGTPHINYTDLNVGSGTGGDTGNGVYVRIFGSHFGSSQGSGTVTLGGPLVTNCSLCSWTDTQIIAQLGSQATTGQIVVTANGLQSNGVPFTVTPTTIVFVSPNGSDSNSGTFASPFKSWRAAFNSVTSNDSRSPSQNTVIYLEPGTDVSFDDGRGYKAAISIDLGGTSATNQLSIVGFPGGTVNVGSTSISYGTHGWGKFVTIANLNIVGQVSAIDAEAGNSRIINNSLSCPAPPSGLGGTACVLGETTDPSETWAFQGNNVHDTGGNVDKTYHAVYFSSNVNHADVGWNNVGQNFKGYCRGIMFHATQGANQFDLHVHDNIVTNSYCDGIGLASTDPSQGTVEIYNNVVAHAALASNPYGVANEAGIAINSDPAGSSSGMIEVYNNTVVDAGAYTTGNQNGCFGVVTSGAGIHLTNNICSQPSASQPYIEKGSTNVTGSNNLWFGAGAAPSWDSAPITSNPLLDTTIFSLLPGSPASGNGTTSITSPFDIIGVPRGSRPSLGAYQ
jgi:hypothetical protein